MTKQEFAELLDDFNTLNNAQFDLCDGRKIQCNIVLTTFTDQQTNELIEALNAAINPVLIEFAIKVKKSIESKVADL